MSSHQVPVSAQLAPYLEGDLDERVRAYFGVVGRLFASRPDQEDLLAVRELTAARVDRASGEPAYGEQAPATEWIVALRCFDDLIGGYLESLPAKEERGLRQRVLLRVAEHPARPGEIADDFDRGLPQISKILSELRASGLIELQAETQVGDGRSRLYRLTSEGWSEIHSLGLGDGEEPLPRAATSRERPATKMPQSRSGRIDIGLGSTLKSVSRAAKKAPLKRTAAKKATAAASSAKKAPAKKATAKKAAKQGA